MVVRMAPGHQHDIVVLAKVEHLPHALKRHHDSSVGVWKAFLVDKGRIVIDDTHSETSQGCGTHQRRDNMPPTKHGQPGCGQDRLQQKSQRAAIRSVVILDDTLFPKQHFLPAVLYERFESLLTQPTHHRAVVTHQELALARGVVWMLREDGYERATMSRVLQGNERA